MDAASSATPVAAAPPSEKPPPVPAWPRSAQIAAVFLLGVAMTLLAVHGCRGLRWGSRPTDLEQGALPAYKIDLNRADRAELLQVPGLGPSLAQRILDYRSEHGSFQNIDELRHVHGVGPTILERFRPWLTVRPWRPDSPVESHMAMLRSAEIKAASSATDAGGRKSVRKKDVQPTDPINVNTATLTDLQRLPSVGPKRAQLIIDERQKRPFASIDELRRVPGIGAKTLEKLRPYITIGEDALRVVTTDGDPSP
jgi:competence protein ComEA